MCEVSKIFASTSSVSTSSPYTPTDGRSARVNSTFACRIATLYGHHIVRLNRYSARMSGEV